MTGRAIMAAAAVSIGFILLLTSGLELGRLYRQVDTLKDEQVARKALDLKNLDANRETVRATQAARDAERERWRLAEEVAATTCDGRVAAQVKKIERLDRDLATCHANAYDELATYRLVTRCQAKIAERDCHEQCWPPWRCADACAGDRGGS